MLPEGYIGFLESLKEKIRVSRQSAAIAVNKELLNIYWEIGNAILNQQQLSGWGSKVIDSLSQDLKSDFPDFKGLSVRNLKYMLAFAKAYPDFQLVQGGLAQIDQAHPSEIVQVPLAQLPWYHHITLLDRVKDLKTRLFYIKKCVENGWSRDVMVHQIETNLHLREGKSITNFHTTLPNLQSDLAHQTLKNPYILDFLNLTEDIKEKDLEKSLIGSLKNFLLELGNGFAYVGNQKNLVVEGDDFFLDLLFYNYKLHCFVVIELKIGDFKPEYAGKLNFYINVVNNQLKGENDNQTIGILLCKTPNQTVVKFSLQDIQQPIGVSEYHLQTALPDYFQGGLPTVEELEAELDKEYQELKSPVDKKLSKIQELLENMNKGQHLQELKSDKTTKKIFHEFFEPLTELIFTQMQEKIAMMFTEFRISLNVNLHEMNSLADMELMVSKPLVFGEKAETVDKLGIFVHGLGLKAAGSKAFDHWERLVIIFEKYVMRIGVRECKGEDLWMEKMYHDIPSDSDITYLAEKYMEFWLEELGKKIEALKG